MVTVTIVIATGYLYSNTLLYILYKMKYWCGVNRVNRGNLDHFLELQNNFYIFVYSFYIVILMVPLQHQLTPNSMLYPLLIKRNLYLELFKQQ